MTDAEFRTALAAKALAATQEEESREALKKFREDERSRLVQEFYGRIRAKVSDILGLPITECPSMLPGMSHMTIKMPGKKVEFKPVSLHCWHILVDDKKIDPAIVINGGDDRWNLWLNRIQIDQDHICPIYIYRLLPKSLSSF